MTFIADLWAGKEAISVMADLASLLDRGRMEDDPSLRETMLTLRVRASESADRLSREIQELARELGRLDVDLDRPEQNIANQLGYFLDLPRRIRLNRLTRQFHEIQSTVRGFSDDVEQLLLCANRRRDDLGTTTYAVRMRMASMSLANAPMREQLDTMIVLIEDIGRSLRD